MQVFCMVQRGTFGDECTLWGWEVPPTHPRADPHPGEIGDVACLFISKRFGSESKVNFDFGTILLLLEQFVPYKGLREWKFER